MAPLVALAHLAALWLLTRSTIKPRAVPDLQVALVSEAGLSGPPAISRASSPAGPSSAPQPQPQPQPPPQPQPEPKPTASPTPESLEPPPPPAPPPPDEVPPEAPSPPDPTLEPTELNPQALERLNAQAAAAGGGAASDADEAACGVVERLQQALTADPTAREALKRVPVPTRSVANAVSLWNGAWADPATLGGEGPAAVLKSVIVQQLATISPQCRNQQLAGPRLLLLANTEGPNVAAIGSGRWRWSDLLP